MLADDTGFLTAYVYDMEVLELFCLGQPSFFFFKAFQTPGPGVQICNFIPKAKYVHCY